MTKRRVVRMPRRLAGLTMVAALLLGACQPAAAPPPAPPAAAPAATRPAEAAKAAEAAKPAADAKPAASGEPIRIGFSAAMSGGLGGLGTDQSRGGELAVEEIKTLLGRPLEWVARDDKNDPGEATKQAEQLVAHDTVSVMTGFVSSSHTMALHNVYKLAQSL